MQKRYLSLLMGFTSLLQADSADCCPTHLHVQKVQEQPKLCEIKTKMIVSILQRSNRSTQLTPKEQLGGIEPYKKEVEKPRWMEWP